LENGRVLYKGDLHGFQSSGVINSLAQSGTIESTGRDEAEAVPDQTIEKELQTEKDEGDRHSPSSTEVTSEDNFSGTVTPLDANPRPDKKGPRKLVEEETRAVGRIGRSVWETYIKACGGVSYWLIFAVLFLLAAASPVAENGWLRYAYCLIVIPSLRDLSSYWSGASQGKREPRSPMFYIEMYALVSILELLRFRLSNHSGPAAHRLLAPVRPYVIASARWLLIPCSIIRPHSHDCPLVYPLFVMQRYSQREFYSHHPRHRLNPRINRII
jgi:hypothetical protein